VVDAVREVTGHPVPVVLGPRRPGDPAQLVAASDRIRAELGWVPEKPALELMVGDAWEWLQQNLARHG
jgi:UDP-glucose 4-epimerase